MIRFLLILGIFIVGSTSQVWAISNGGFETGDFTGWSTIERGAEVEPRFRAGSGSGISPTEGKFLATIFNVGDFNNKGRGLENLLDLPSGTLETAFGKEVRRGALITQRFSASAGDLVTFDWRYFTQEEHTDTAPDSDDLAFLSFNGKFTVLANVFSDLVPADHNSSFFFESGWRSGSVIIPHSGIHTLGFGAVELLGLTNDADDSALLIDNVAVNPVPEPSSIFLLGSGLVGLTT